MRVNFLVNLNKIFSYEHQACTCEDFPSFLVFLHRQHVNANWMPFYEDAVWFQWHMCTKVAMESVQKYENVLKITQARFILAQSGPVFWWPIKTQWSHFSPNLARNIGPAHRTKVCFFISFSRILPLDEFFYVANSFKT